MEVGLAQCWPWEGVGGQALAVQDPVREGGEGGWVPTLAGGRVNTIAGGTIRGCRSPEEGHRCSLAVHPPVGLCVNVCVSVVWSGYARCAYGRVCVMRAGYVSAVYGIWSVCVCVCDLCNGVCLCLCGMVCVMWGSVCCGCVCCGVVVPGTLPRGRAEGENGGAEGVFQAEGGREQPCKSL